MQFPPAKRNPPARRNAAMTLPEVLLVIVVVVILVGLLFPVRRSKIDGPRLRCVNNLKQIGLAYYMWANDHGGKYPEAVSITNGGVMELASGGNVFPYFQIVSNELNDPRVLICPVDIEKKPAINFTNDFNDSHISYFVNADAFDSNPAVFLSGDRNLARAGTPLPHGVSVLTTNDVLSWTDQIHKRRGNIGLADGSVQQLGSDWLREGFQTSGLATNRLVLP
jgi:prepilin-type processing-associated H-X9-DG protein